MTSEELEELRVRKRRILINRDYENFQNRIQMSKWKDNQTEACLRLACLVTFCESLSTRVNLTLARKLCQY